MTARDRSNGLKERLAYETARILIEQGLQDFDRARRKAAERTGVRDRRAWPTNEAVREAVMMQQRLFQGDSQRRACQILRARAGEAMRNFAAYSPRLAGAVLDGTADTGATIELFLFVARPEEVVLALLEQKIPFEQAERHFRYPDGERRVHPVFRFVAGETPYELVALPEHAKRTPPLDPISERPQRGADALALEKLLLAAEND